VKKSEIYGLVGSILITGILILLLFIIVMPGLKEPEDEGIMVSFGEMDMGSGKTETPTEQPTAKSVTPPPATPKPAKQELMTQDANSLAIAEQKKKDRKEKEVLEQQRLEEIRIANEKNKAKQEAIDKANAMNGLFGNSNSAGSGTTSGDSRQGNPAGSGNAGGNSWSLNGRDLMGTLVKPNYDSNVEGRISVNIRVDENGNVISASIGKPTDISDAATLSAARSAAKRTRFTKGNGVSTGSITYNFKLR
jgi:TonB family protein